MKPGHLICAGTGAVIGIAAQLLFVQPGIRGSGPESKSPSTTSAKLTGLTSREPGGPVGREAALGDHLSEPAATREQIADYLERHGRSKQALVVAYLVSKNDKHLVDAARRFPDDPNVQFLVLSADALPDERGDWLERFKKSQPDNLLSSLFFAGDLLEKGELEAGLDELRAATKLDGYEDFSIENGLAMEAALIELGHSRLDAKFRSIFGGNPTEHLQRTQRQLRVVHKSAQQAETPEEKEELAIIGTAVGFRLATGGAGLNRLNQLVGLSFAKSYYPMLSEDEPLPGLGVTPKQIAAEYERVRLRITADGEFTERLGELNEQQLIHLIDRSRVMGELAANNWFRSQLGEPWIEGKTRP